MQSILPSSVFEGVAAAACSALGVDNLESRRAAARWRAEEATDVAAAMYAVIWRNYQLSGASARRDRSRENWRWSLQSGISAANTSPEVVLERAIARACLESGRDDWANQVPVASGLGSDTGDRRRALDLVRRVGAGHYEFIELKIGSNTPLSAAVELLGYACLWLLARGDPPATERELLNARKVDLRVLAPEAETEMSRVPAPEAETEMSRMGRLPRWNLGVFAAPRAGWAKGFAGGPSRQGETPDGPLRRASCIRIRLSASRCRSRLHVACVSG